ncbi:hypothetical protein ACFLT5_01750 [Chloroflexota bacterium]
MPSKEQTPDRDHDRRGQWSLQSPAQPALTRAAPYDWATTIQRARFGAGALKPSDVRHLQRTVGNRAVSRLLSGTIQRVKATKVTRSNKELPTEPSIAANASRGSTWGVHASIFLARGKPKAMQYQKIDLTYGKHGKLGTMAKLGKSLFGRHGDKEKGVKINVEDATSWIDPGTSTTWQIKNEQAQAAYDKGLAFEKNQDKYWYSHLGIGWRGYNCAKFAEKILQAAGIKRTSGLIFKTPSELVTGKKLPKWSLSWKSKQGKALIEQTMRELEEQQARENQETEQNV